MKLSLTVLMTFLCLSAIAQKKTIKPKQPLIKKADYSYLKQTTDILSGEALVYSVTGFGQSVNRIPKQLEAIKMNDSISVFERNEGRDIIKSNLPLIFDYIAGIIQFGETDAEFLKWNGSSIKIGLYKNEPTFIQSHIFSKYEINSYKLDADARIEHVVKNIILPSLPYFKPLLKDERLKYFVLNVGFRTRDFTEDKPYFGSGEMVAMLISRDDLLKYSNAELSDKEVLKSSVFYNYNSNMSAIKKITY